MNDELAVRLIGSIDRLSTAVEQAVLTALDRHADPYPPHLDVPDEPVPLPPMTASVVPQMADVCPVHKLPWKFVPAGISKKTGNPYDAFRACPTTGCTQRPVRA